MTRIPRNRSTRWAMLLGTVLLAAACGDSSTAAGNGTLVVRLTDAPFLVDSVSRVDIFVVRVDARRADADSATAAKGSPDDSATAGGWTTVATPNALVNLLAYQNGAELSLGSGTIASGDYLGFRLVIDPSKSSLTLKTGLVLSGTTAPTVSFPSGSRSGIKIVLTQPVTVRADETTTVLIDFMVADSFVMRGTSLSLNGLIFKPVIHATVK